MIAKGAGIIYEGVRAGEIRNSVFRAQILVVGMGQISLLKIGGGSMVKAHNFANTSIY